MCAAPAGSTLKFPTPSLLLFITGAVLLRAFAVVGSGFFPGDRFIPCLARVIFPLLSAAGLVWLNQAFLARAEFPRDALGLRPVPAHLARFLAGGAIVTGVVALVVGILWVLVPFHYARGLLTVRPFSWQAAAYFTGNWGEELMFRGYLLLILARWRGLPWALVCTSLLFGLFHLPGMSGIAALKMVCTTFLGGCLYAYGYALTRTLWTAAGLHVIGNIVLHHVFGASQQNSFFVPVFHRPWPTSYDPAFVAWLVVFLPLLALAAKLPVAVRK